MRDEDDFEPPIPEPIAPQPVMMPLPYFKVYYDNNSEVEIVGVIYHDEEMNFIGIDGAEGEIWPSIIRSPTFREKSE